MEESLRESIDSVFAKPNEDFDDRSHEGKTACVTRSRLATLLLLCALCAIGIASVAFVAPPVALRARPPRASASSPDAVEVVIFTDFTAGLLDNGRTWIEGSTNRYTIPDVDDAYALLQAIRDPRLRVLGVVIQFGNAAGSELEKMMQQVRKLLAAAGYPDYLFPLGLHLGSREPFNRTSAAPSAVVGLARALQHRKRQSVSLVSISPLSDIAYLLRELQQLPGSLDVLRSVIVEMGHYGSTWGSTPSFKLCGEFVDDMNFLQDVEAARYFLESLKQIAVPPQVYFVPFQTILRIKVSHILLGTLKSGVAGDPGKLLAQWSIPWYEQWVRRFDCEGSFHLWDATIVLAARGLPSPEEYFLATPVHASIVEPNSRLAADNRSITLPYLHLADGVSNDTDTLSGRVLYAWRNDITERVLPPDSLAVLSDEEISLLFLSFIRGSSS